MKKIQICIVGQTKVITLKTTHVSEADGNPKDRTFFLEGRGRGNSYLLAYRCPDGGASHIGDLYQNIAHIEEARDAYHINSWNTDKVKWMETSFDMKSACKVGHKPVD